jgi:2-polyprenyl-3-methyl-5-hydroxy-6-metoxy-1,4-benzoquinol methylase
MGLREKSTPKRLLDVGCGDGTIGQKIQSLSSFTVYGVDSSKANVSQCKKRKIFAKQVNIDLGIPYEDNYFDVVFAGEIIEHIIDTEHLFREFHRVLKPKGILLITTPNLTHLPDRIRFLRGLNPSNVSPTHHFLKLHVRPFTLNTLVQAFDVTDFKKTSVQSTMIVFLWVNEQVKISSIILANIFPTLGNTLIVQAIKK